MPPRIMLKSERVFGSLTEGKMVMRFIRLVDSPMRNRICELTGTESALIKPKLKF